MKSFRTVFLLLLFGGLGISSLQAGMVADVSPTSMVDQALRFLRLEDASVRYALAGVVILGTCCGILGGFLVVRKMSLVGDTLSHAVLPGVAAGFLWNIHRDPVAIFVGATLSGLAGTALIGAITRTTRLKEDAALGIVLSSFYALGVCMVTRIQKIPGGNKSGIDQFLFGQAAALGQDDLILMSVVLGLILVLVISCYKELLAASFDPLFARCVGIPVDWTNRALMFLTAFTVVISLQAVGVVLVSAMLITPAATAWLLTDRLHRLLAWSAALGVAAGIFGVFVSFLGHRLPTGPFMILAASLLFVLAFVFSPRHGWGARLWNRLRQARRIRRENTLKAVYHLAEAGRFQRETISLEELAGQRRKTLEESGAEIQSLVRHRLATWDATTGAVCLTPAGWKRASEIVRNHRLWELYLTHAAELAPDHVHEDAEKIEHILGEDIVRQLERRLNFASVDPHGKIIPGPGDLARGGPPVRPHSSREAS
jgi:manganese/zinc/iron transport system permease protein